MGRLFRLTIIQLCRAIILAVAFGLLFVTGVDYLARILEMDRVIGRLYEWVPLARMDVWPLLVLGTLCVIAPFFYVLIVLMDRRLARGIVGRGKSGEDICLTPEAVERAVVRDVKAAVPDIVRVRTCRAAQGRSAAHVVLQLVVTGDHPVPEVQSQTRRVVRETLERLIGYSDGAQVRVRIDGLARGGAAPRKKSKKNGKSPRRAKPAAAEATS